MARLCLNALPLLRLERVVSASCAAACAQAAAAGSVRQQHKQQQLFL